MIAKAITSTVVAGLLGINYASADFITETDKNIFESSKRPTNDLSIVKTNEDGSPIELFEHNVNKIIELIQNSNLSEEEKNRKIQQVNAQTKNILEKTKLKIGQNIEKIQNKIELIKESDTYSEQTKQELIENYYSYINEYNKYLEQIS